MPPQEESETETLVEAPSLQQPPLRVPGLVRFLPDQLALYPYDALLPQQPSRRRRRRRRASEECLPVVDKTMVNLLDHVRTNLVVVFVFDAEQPHSLRLRNALVDLLATRRDLLFGVAISSVPAADEQIHSHPEEQLESAAAAASPCTAAHLVLTVNNTLSTSNRCATNRLAF